MKAEASMTDQPKDMDDDLVDPAFPERLEKALGVKLPSAKISMRSAVALAIMAIVDRQIGKGDPEAIKEWEKLRGVVEAHPAANAQVTELQAALQKYEDDLQKQIKAGADEEQVRRTAATIVKMAIMSKMKSFQTAAASARVVIPTAAAAPAVPAAAEPAEKQAASDPKAAN
jgi:hypothetical protein